MPAQTRSVDAWGIQRDWIDSDDLPQTVASETVESLRAVIDTPPDDLEQRAPIVTRPGRELGLGRVEVTCEDGSEHVVEGRLPEDFPLGYHRLRTPDGTGRRLIVSPGRCWLPERQSWGWAVQLYAARSAASWGIGDLGDLRNLRAWTEREGGGFLLVNPLHAVAPTTPQEASPYLPATRRFRNPLYLRVDEVPGYSDADVDAEEVRRVAAEPLIDRDGVWAVKRVALAAAYRRVGDDPAFSSWRDAQGASLEEFATWCVLAEEHGPDWHAWPDELRRPDGPAVAAFRAAHDERIAFHAWLQWQLDAQLRAASGDLTVLQDLPIGVSGGGADSWAWQDVLAQGVAVGAPPDALNSLGQSWGSPPLVPWRLREAEYEPFIQSVRGTIAGAGGLRIDHVMGLFRLWWIPEGAGATDGAYVRYPSDDLLDIVALESHRARAVVVGEDLGTVEPGVPEALAERGILSYKVLWFEEDDPADWPAGALATVTTHDLPTVAGLWTGSDAVEQHVATGIPEAEVQSGRRDLLEKLTRDGLAADATPADAVAAAYAQLARAGCLLLQLSLEDAVLEERRPNIPGTVDRDNWRIPLPVPVDRLADSPQAARLVRLVTEALAGRSAQRRISTTTPQPR
ncbi:4-alpha-glucanotransferase [Nocardioides sp. T2.26MG-1]|uniref:4-alpha-glucanotransferase n=1 Tax=Nocardioides sp. T2.26MG-1 TaxID=3041166 RepID=UPI0024777596|nr:4-alpha-glucanotransferase [Nocardioides sp. T2.26MG-1]CAI9411298.1 4-alpha-glucanotransferase [Nocardioides sp. T2.26MG-1]